MLSDQGPKLFADKPVWVQLNILVKYTEAVLCRYVQVNIEVHNCIWLNPCPAFYPAFANSVDPDQLASEEAN